MPPRDEGTLDQIRDLLAPFRRKSQRGQAEHLVSRLRTLSGPLTFAGQPDDHSPVTNPWLRATRAAAGRLTSLGDARDRFLSTVTEISGTADDWCNPNPYVRTRALDALRIHILSRCTYRMGKEAQKRGRAKEALEEEGTFLNDPRMPCGMEFMTVLSQAGEIRRVDTLTLSYNLLILNRGSAWLYETVGPKEDDQHPR